MSLSAAMIAPLQADMMLLFLLQLAVLLLTAFLLGRLAVLVRMPAIVGELCAGVLLGPSVLAHVAPALSSSLVASGAQQQHLLDAVAQIGVLLLVGITGMHMDLRIMRGRKATAIRVSTAGFVLPMGLGVGVGLLLPAILVPSSSDRLTFALFLGVALGISAIPVIAKTLLELRMLHRDLGQLTMCAVMLDDVVGWTLLAVVSAMATTGLSGGTIATTVGGLALVAVLALLLRPLVRWILRQATQGTDHGPVTAVVTVLILLGATGTHALGLEAVFGAFTLGLVISSCRTVSMEQVKPLRTTVLSVLAPVFFATAGLRMDLTALGDPTVLVTGAVVLVIAVLGKFAGAYLGARMSKLGHWEALALGAGMNARGVIEVIIGTVGLRLGVLSPQMYTVIVLVAIMTSLLAPPILRWAMSRTTETSTELARAKTYQMD